MPPRKKARTSTTTSPGLATTSSPQIPSPTSEAHDKEDEATQSLLNDPWTDAEESALFKALIKHKPTGLHKHMHMSNIITYLLSHGYVSEEALSNRLGGVAGIWKKLNGLYDLEALDEREEAGDEILHPPTPSSDASVVEKGNAASDDSDDEEGLDEEIRNVNRSRPFNLPSDDEEWTDLKWAKRFPTQNTTGTETSTSTTTKRSSARRRSSSPPLLPDLLPTKDDVPVRFVPEDISVDGSVTSESSEERVPKTVAGRPSTRGGRGGGRGRGGRGAAVAAAAAQAARIRRSSRVADSVATEEEEEEDDDDDDEDEEKVDEQEEEAEEEEEEEAQGSGEGEESGDGEQSSSAEEESGATPAPKATRGRGGGRGGRGRPRGRKRR